MAYFFLLTTWRRIIWAEWVCAVPYNLDTTRFYKEVEKLIKEFGLMTTAAA